MARGKDGRYPHPYRVNLILLPPGWTIFASLIENRPPSDISCRSLPSAARTRTLLTLFQCAGSDYQYHNHHDRVIGNRRQYRAIAGWRGARSGYLFRFANPRERYYYRRLLFSLKTDEYRRLVITIGPLT